MMSSLLSPHLDLVFMRNIRPRLHLHLFELSIYPSHLIRMLQLSTDLHFHFELLRLHPLARYSSADISKVLEAASLVTPGDFSSFHHVFNDQSLRVFSQAEQIDASRHPISAREAYFRPSTYFRAADFYLHGNPSDFRMIRLLDAQIECFDKAIALLPNPGRRVLLKSEGEEGCSAAERSDGLGAITFLEMIERLLTIKPLGIIV
jgi:hypothetical protein